jgi:type I restriction enzyme R subunit
LVAVTWLWGGHQAEDFLEGFAYVHDNINNIAALGRVQRPRRSEELRAASFEGLFRSHLQRAWAMPRTGYAASIIGFVRQAALVTAGPYRTGQLCVQRVMASRAWTDPQKRWLRRIAEQIERNQVDRKQSTGSRRADGGFVRVKDV